MRPPLCVFSLYLPDDVASRPLPTTIRRGIAAYLEITFISGRPKEKRLGLLRALNDGVVAAAEISPEDLLITLYETPGENISFGRGLAQRAHISETDPKPAYADHHSVQRLSRRHRE